MRHRSIVLLVALVLAAVLPAVVPELATASRIAVPAMVVPAASSDKAGAECYACDTLVTDWVWNRYAMEYQEVFVSECYDLGTFNHDGWEDCVPGDGGFFTGPDPEDWVRDDCELSTIGTRCSGECSYVPCVNEEPTVDIATVAADGRVAAYGTAEPVEMGTAGLVSRACTGAIVARSYAGDEIANYRAAIGSLVL